MWGNHRAGHGSTRGAGLVEFVGKCRDRGIWVALSTWFNDDARHRREEIRLPADYARIWAETLELLDEHDLLDAVAWVDLCNEFPMDVWAWGAAPDDLRRPRDEHARSPPQASPPAVDGQHEADDGAVFRRRHRPAPRAVAAPPVHVQLQRLPLRRRPNAGRLGVRPGRASRLGKRRRGDGDRVAPDAPRSSRSRSESASTPAAPPGCGPKNAPSGRTSSTAGPTIGRGGPRRATCRS